MLEELDIQEGLATKYGLKPVYLRGLGDLIILAGASGSGKSRVLSCVQAEVQAQNKRRELQANIRILREVGEKASQEQLASFEAELAALSRSRLRVLEVTEVIPFQPGDTDPRNILEADGMDARQRARLLTHRPALNLEENYKQMGATLTSFALALHHGQNPNRERDPDVIAGIARAGAFNDLLRNLLGTEVAPAIVDALEVPAIFGRAFNSRELSPSQRTLLAWAITLHARSDGKELADRAVITIDEPELHLHPASVVDVIRGFYRHAVKGSGRQLWIATHSASLLAEFADTADIFFVDSGAVKTGRERFTGAMDGLLGGPDGRERLRTFLGDMDEAAFTTFVAQCVADVLVSNRSDDRQSKQFLGAVSERAACGGTVRVLDYGAGKGRFARALAERPELERPKVDYFTYDDPNYDADRSAREANVKLLYPDEDPRARCRSDMSDFVHSENSRVDVVVMCNFLHEVPPRDWQANLTNTYRALRTDGTLLVIEDLRMSVGELPSATGYIVLGESDLRELLGSSDDVFLHATANERCSIVVVRRVALSSATRDDWAERLVSTLRGVRARTLQDIRQLRETKGHGTDHARAVVQLANVTLALRDLGVA
jgi:SAM-dependent methyltransferase/ABC-type histidine transport system ATPase subunit